MWVAEEKCLRTHQEHQVGRSLARLLLTTSSAFKIHKVHQLARSSPLPKQTNGQSARSLARWPLPLLTQASERTVRSIARSLARHPRHLLFHPGKRTASPLARSLARSLASPASKRASELATDVAFSLFERMMLMSRCGSGIAPHAPCSSKFCDLVERDSASVGSMTSITAAPSGEDHAATSHRSFQRSFVVRPLSRVMMTRRHGAAVGMLSLV